jgi:hypothetical protein
VSGEAFVLALPGLRDREKLAETSQAPARPAGGVLLDDDSWWEPLQFTSSVQHMQ